MASLAGAVATPGSRGVIVELDTAPGDGQTTVLGRIRGRSGRDNGFFGVNCTGPFRRFPIERAFGDGDRWPYQSRFAGDTGAFEKLIFDTPAYSINALDLEFVTTDDFAAAGGDTANWSGTGVVTVDDVPWGAITATTPQPDVTAVERGPGQLTVRFDKGAVPFGLEGVVNFRWRVALAGLDNVTLRRNVQVDAAFVNDPKSRNLRNVWSDTSSPDLRALRIQYLTDTSMRVSIARAPAFSIPANKRLYIDSHDAPYAMPAGGNGPWTVSMATHAGLFEALSGLDAGQGLPLAVADPGAATGRDASTALAGYRLSSSATRDTPFGSRSSPIALCDDGTFWYLHGVVGGSVRWYHFSSTGSFLGVVLVPLGTTAAIGMPAGRLLLAAPVSNGPVQYRGYNANGSRWSAGDVRLAVASNTRHASAWRDPETGGYLTVNTRAGEIVVDAFTSAGARNQAADVPVTRPPVSGTRGLSGDASRLYAVTTNPFGNVAALDRVTGAFSIAMPTAAGRRIYQLAGYMAGRFWVQDGTSPIGDVRLVSYIVPESGSVAWQEVCCVETDHHTVTGLTVDEQMLIELEGASPLGLADVTYAVGAARADLAPTRPDAPTLTNSRGMVRLDWVNADG